MSIEKKDTAATATGDYRERLTVPWYAWLICLLAAVCVAAVSIAFLGPAGVLTVAVVTLALCALLLWRMGAVVEVGGGRLRAGRASIPLVALGRARPLTAVAAARLRGRDIEPTAFHLICSWVSTAVQVEVRDPADPTPYWYVSTRHPDRLAAALAHPERTDPDLPPHASSQEPPTTSPG